jgi:hypothetical protein
MSGVSRDVEGGNRQSAALHGTRENSQSGLWHGPVWASPHRPEVLPIGTSTKTWRASKSVSLGDSNEIKRPQPRCRSSRAVPVLTGLLI